MGTSLRRHRFRPSLDEFRLEDRVVLSTAGAVVADAAAAKAAVATQGMVKSSSVQASGVQLHSAFQTFSNQATRAAKNAINAVGKGQTEANALNSLTAFISLQGGILEAKVQQLSQRLPEGVPNLFDLVPDGTVPTGRAAYVPANLRLKKQIDDMLNTLKTNANTLQNAVNQTASLTILQTYQGSKAAMGRYVNMSVANGDFVLVHG